MLSKRDREYLEEQKTKLSIEDFLLEVKKVKANIPLKFRHYTFDDITYPKLRNAIDKIKEYTIKLEENYKTGTGLYIWGRFGLAKSTTASLVLVEALKKGKSAYFTDLSKCIDLLTNGWYNDDYKREFAEKIIETDFLVLDDVGREYNNGKLIPASFDSIFRERSNNLLPTIITSNKSITKIGENYGDRLVSLFYEHLIQVQCVGIDYRKEVIAKSREK